MADIYNWFTEGFDTVDLKDAKALLEELSRLWRQQGKKEEARQMLAEVYNWFTEGFDTKDLQDAKALLDELS